MESKPRPAREGQGRNAGVDASEESDRAVVPVNSPNKEDEHSAEAGEERARTEEKVAGFHTVPTLSGMSPWQPAICGTLCVPLIIRGRSRMR